MRGFVGGFLPWALIIFFLWGTGDSQDSGERSSSDGIDIELIIGPVLLLVLVCGLLRLAVTIRPRLANRLGVVPNIDQLSADMVANLPDRMSLAPAPDTRFRNAAALDQLVARLAARGFVRVGTYVPDNGPRVPVVLLAHSDARAYAVVWEALARSRLRVDYVSVFPDGRRVTYTTDVDRGLNPPPGCPDVHAPGADEIVLLDRFLDERPAADYTPVTPANAVETFEQVSARYFAWRREAGFTREELAAVFGRMIVSALDIFLLAAAYLCLPLGLYGIWRYAGGDMPAWCGVVVLCVALALVLIPILFAGRVFRFLHNRFVPEGGAMGTSAPVETVAKESGAFSLRPMVGSIHEDPESVRPVAGVLRSIGFLPAGAFASPLDELVLWVQPETGVYAIVWQAHSRPWVEMVAAGADGRCWRVQSVAGPDPAGEVYALYDRCLELRDGLPLAELTPQVAPHVFEQHAAADPDWRERTQARVSANRQEWFVAFQAENRRNILWASWSIGVCLAVDVAVIIWWNARSEKTLFPGGVVAVGLGVLPVVGTFAVLSIRHRVQKWRGKGH